MSIDSRLSRTSALEEAAQIAEDRAHVWRTASQKCRGEGYSAAAEFRGFAASEAELIARLIRERMQNRRVKP